MQFVILKKRKSKVSLFKVCKCEDLMGMTAAMIEANIEALRSAVPTNAIIVFILSL